MRHEKPQIGRGIIKTPTLTHFNNVFIYRKTGMTNLNLFNPGLCNRLDDKPNSF